MSHKAVLMSIKPKYAEMIFDGRKTIELRRVCPKVSEGDLVLVYVSGPRMALIGGFSVRGVVSGSPKELCREWLESAGVTKEVFMAYFAGVQKSHGILIGETWKLDTETELQSLRSRRGGFHPPQSYRYLGQREFLDLVS